jgi:hypothetical protein
MEFGKKELIERANINHMYEMKDALLLLKENLVEHYKNQRKYSNERIPKVWER